MKIVVIAQYNPNLFPALHRIAAAIADTGSEVHFLSSVDPKETGVDARNVPWTGIPQAKGLAAHILWFRSNGPHVFQRLRKIQPDWIMAEHEYLVPTLAYKLLARPEAKVAAYFSDYHGDRKYLKLLKPLAGFLDAYVDVCDVRRQWRARDWPRMQARPFIIRQGPCRRENALHTPHQGPARIVFTGSRYVLGLDRGRPADRSRLARFLTRLCGHGIAVDWYLPGPEDVRVAARQIMSHPLFTVRYPVEKSRLLETLEGYDVGLHWAPKAEEDHDPDYFHSAASNKIGEYIAAGLAVAHAGNPGLAYLPGDVCIVFDPTDPEAGADRLATEMSDRAEVERKREAALRYHLEDMNFEAQAEPFIRHVMEEAAARPA